MSSELGHWVLINKTARDLHPWLLEESINEWLKAVYCILKNSIRRFLDRPSRVSLGAMGSSGPNPLV